MKARTIDAYVLITPARNEEDFIEETIRSVVSQTVLPKRWVIVSDGSVDRTDAIVQSYARKHPWMQFIRVPGSEDRNFASKVRSFNAGYETMKGLDYDIIGNLDADISFESEYIEYLLAQFTLHPDLGVAGTPFSEGNVTYDYRFSNIEHVSGGCQIFRRQCFEAIGGYMPIEGGGIDWVAVTTARMKGWKTQTFTGKNAFHHRKMGTADRSVLKARFNLGREDYSLGSHPLWAFLRAVYQMKNPPYLFGGLFTLLGYVASAACRKERPVSQELIDFYRQEQRQRLRDLLSKALRS